MTVRVKPRTRDVKNLGARSFQNSSLEYEAGASQFSNFARLGLLADANQIGREKGRITGFNPRVKDPVAVLSGPDGPSEPHPLEVEMAPALKTVRKVPAGERAVLAKLLAAHGDDYAAMARDGRRNALQHTAAHLRRRIEKMREEDAEDLEVNQEHIAKGMPPPPPRLRRKLTKDPNPAFKKRSKNFN